MSIPFDALYSSDKDGNVLPSDQRNMNIIRGVNFGIILGHIQKKNINGIESWISDYEKKLEEYLKKYPSKLKPKDLGKHCTNLNYILDYIVQGIYNLDMHKSNYWAHLVDEFSIHALEKYPSLNCRRDLHSYKTKYLIFKKLMLDLCEDIEYYQNLKKPPHHKKCSRMKHRLKYRESILMDFYRPVYHKSIFDFNDKCSISFIYENLKNFNCNKAKEQQNATVASEGATVSVSPSADRADRQVEGKIKETKDEEALERESLQDSGFGDDLDNTEPDDPNLKDLQIGLPFNEDPPKLDTTYAAASLAGISLFGTILYKYGPFRNRLNSRRGAINGSNIFPLYNNVYDANTMNNFEYLQTGIPNDEYQVGYGSVTDY